MLSGLVRTTIIVLLTSVPLWSGNPVGAENEECTLPAPFARGDIESLTAEFDSSTGTINVRMRLCEQPVAYDKTMKYRLYFDYRSPFFSDGSCGSTADHMMMRHWKKDNGQGLVVLDPADGEGRTLKYSVTSDELGLGPDISNLYIYANTQMSDGRSSGIIDRSPNTDVTDVDTCADPETSSEVLNLSLSSQPVLSCSCWSDKTLSELISYLEGVPSDAITTLNKNCGTVEGFFSQLLFQDIGDGLPHVVAQALKVDDWSFCELSKAGADVGMEMIILDLSSDEATKCVNELAPLVSEISWCQ